MKETNNWNQAKEVWLIKFGGCLVETVRNQNKTGHGTSLHNCADSTMAMTWYVHEGTKHI